MIFKIHSRSHLHGLSGPEKEVARAISAIHQTGTSFNEIAKALKCSPSLLRRLLQALQSPLEDQLLAQSGKLKTNELVRRAKAAEIDRAANQRKASEAKRIQASIRGQSNL